MRSPPTRATTKWRRSLWRRIRPFPTVEQASPVDCGAAALLSVLRYWGGNASLPEVRSLAATGLHGASILGLCRAARALGLVPDAARGTYADLRRERTPCIVHLVLPDGRQHFAVLRSAGATTVQVGDPAGQLNRLSREGFEKLWCSRVALLLRPSVEGVVHHPNAQSWIRWIYAFGRRDPGWLPQSVFLGLVSAGLGLLTALFIRALIDRLIPAGDPGLIGVTGGALLLLLFLQAAAQYTRHNFLIQLGRSSSSRMTHEVLTHLFRQPATFFETYRSGDLAARVRDGTRVYRGLAEAGGVMVMDGLMLSASLALLFVLAPGLGPVPLAVLPLHAALVLRRAASLRRGQARTLAALGAAEAELGDSLRGISEIRTSCVAETFAGRVGRRFDTMLARAVALERSKAGLTLLSGLSTSILVAASLSVGGVLVVGGDLGIGELMAGYSLIAGSVSSVDRMLSAYVHLKDVEIATWRVRDLLLPARPSPESAVPAQPIRKSLVLDGTRTEWPRSVPAPASLELPRGSVTAITGPSGSGKTTLLRVLAGDVQTPAGAIRADGKPVDTLATEAHRRRVGFLRAEPCVFRGTLAFNVLLDRVSAEGTLSELEEAGLRSFLDRFPARWATRIGDGTRALSRGERQVMGLMRALVVRPDIILLDEGFSAVDDALRQTMLRFVLAHAQDRILVLATHDPHTLRLAHRVHTLRHGPGAAIPTAAASRP
jgi:ATP-binding cassette, subfamily C, bacteriocin exporter